MRREYSGVTLTTEADVSHGFLGRVLVAILMLATTDAAEAQNGAVQGTVFAVGDSSRLIAGAEVYLDPIDRAVRTDSLGAFRFASVPPGDYRLRVRRLGLEGRVVALGVQRDRATAVQVAMRPVATGLATITIAGHAVQYPARLVGAYARASGVRGHFFMREEIDSLFPLDVKSLLARIPSVHVSDNTVNFVRCREGRHVHVYIDGTRVTNDLMGYTADQALRGIVPSSIQIMEVYTGVSMIPAEFLDDACAVVAVWLR